MSQPTSISLPDPEPTLEGICPSPSIKSTKKYDRHEIRENDFVVVLDKAQQNHEFCYGVVTKRVTRHHFKVRVISRGMKLDNKYKMVRPAVTVELDRAPESLVLLCRMNQSFDPLEFSDRKSSSSGKKVVKERWSLTKKQST